MRIVFWGTPEFALPSLAALLGEGHQVVAVVTQPDRPAGRGREVQLPPVKRLALEEGIPVLQPERPRGDEFRETLQTFGAELSIVVAYGQILRREILDVPSSGSINVHASLLPELRGAAPVNWAIIRGHTLSGVTVMRMSERMDAGPILHQVAEPILEDERAVDLAGRLSEVGAAALIELLLLLDMGEVEERPQDDSLATFAPRLTRADAHLDWSLPATEVDRWIRGLDEVPGAWSLLNGREVKLYRPKPVVDAAPGDEPGTVLEVHGADAADGILVGCGSGAVWVREVKPAGRRRMNAAAWVRGRGVRPGDRFD